MYSCAIEFSGTQKDVANLKRLFETEKKVADARSSWNFQAKEKKIFFNIKAKDAVALRATANTIMKNLAVYEKTNKIKNG